MPKSGNKSTDNNSLSYEINRFKYYREHLYRLLGDTKKAIKDIKHLNLFPLESTVGEAVKLLQDSVKRPTAIVILGSARAKLVNFLLGEELLPTHAKSSKSNDWRWLRLQHGLQKQIRLSFGEEYEIIESNFSSEFDWDQIKSHHLKRSNDLDFSTVVDIKLCNPFLENGVQLLLPPDIGDVPSKSPFAFASDFITDYKIFSTKKGSFFENVFPIILYALDEIDTIKCTNITDISNGNVKVAHKNMQSNFDISDVLKPQSNDKKSTFYIKIDTQNSIDDYKSCNSNFSAESSNNLSCLSNLKERRPSLLYNKILPGLNEESLCDLLHAYELHPNMQVLFVFFSEKNPRHDVNGKPQNENIVFNKERQFLNNLSNQLQQICNSFFGQWIIISNNMKNVSDISSSTKSNKKFNPESDIITCRSDFLFHLKVFAKNGFQKFILNDCNRLSEINHTLLQQLILSTYDMAREMQVVPRKIEYVAEKEKELYNELINTFKTGKKREELLQIMQKVLIDMKNSINNIDFFLEDSPCAGSIECINLNHSMSIFYSDVKVGDITSEQCPSTSNDISMDISEYSSLETSFTEEDIVENVSLKEYCIVGMPNPETVPPANEETDAIEATNEHLSLLEDEPFCDIDNSLDNDSNVSVNLIDFKSILVSTPNSSNNKINHQASIKQASLKVQKIVLGLLSNKISLQLVKLIDCFRDSYFGTLQRCIESLEEDKKQRTASEAIRQILFVTKTIDLQQYASFSFLHSFFDQIKRFFQRLSISSFGNKSCCSRNARWRKQVAIDTLESLTPSKLTKLISSQLKTRISLSHEKFQSALHSLGEHHAAKLQHAEELKISIRKLHAPRFARLYLESTSLCDLTLHGVPHLGKEIGRGQYGIVYSVKGSWGGYEPCAVKSVVPPDERHFNELAMEFFNTKSLPTHERIVQLRGSVIDYSYKGGNPAVLLISERLQWDLHCALSNGKLPFIQRMQIAVDIVEGIRYLHSQGLVHRDIKMKNVLLDEANRAKLTDLGFCMPESMISGSVVGTPIHMAPELFSNSKSRIYDNSVDVYAFGILFWYLCAGHIRLPSAFQNFQNKDQLWANVEQGLRPERLPSFSKECWDLMEKCWSKDASKRPLLGTVQPILENARDNPHMGADFIFN